MQKKIGLLVLLLLMVCGTAWAGYISPVHMMENLQIVQGGSSVFCLDMTMGVYSDAEIFDIQYSSATPYFHAYSGATLPVFRWATSNHLPVGLSEADIGKKNGFTSTKLQEVLEWTPIIPNDIAHDSGTSRYGWPFKPETRRYLFLKADNASGVTAFKITVDLGMMKHGKGPDGIWISGATYTVHSTSGTSTLTVPDGARKATLMPRTNGIYYTFDSTETPSSQTKQLTAESILTMTGNEARKLRFIGNNAAHSGIRVDYFTQ